MNKVNKKIVVGVVIGAVASTIFSFCLAETLIESSKVSYVDNSKLGATNVQNAIDGTCTKFSSELQNFLLKVYPVGSIYISYSATNPQTLFGGTWESFGKGQTLVGIDTSSTEFKTLGQTGGAKSISYTPGGTIGSTGLTISQIPSHTHDISHTHTTPKTNTSTMSLTAQSAGAHYHDIQSPYGPVYSDYFPGDSVMIRVVQAYNSGGNHGNPAWTTTNGAHTHDVTGTVTVPAMTTNSISTSTSGSAGKGTTSDGHTHSFTGSAATLNNLQPYITVYMWRRTK